MLYQPLPRTLDAALRDVSDPKPLVRVSAVRDLVPHASEARDRVVAALEKALSDDNALVRAHAAEALGDVGAADALSALLVAVEDEHQLVRQKAIAALGEAGDARAQKRLERALSDDRPEVRFQAVIAYARVASSKDDALGAALTATCDDDDMVAHIGFRMVEELTQPDEMPQSVIDRARACLKHESPRVRAVAAVVLASSGDPGADELLVSVVDGTVATPETEDVAAAIDLVADRGIHAARPALTKRANRGVLGFGKDSLWWNARTALARLGDDAAKRAIIADLRSLSFERRTLAVSAVGRAHIVDAKDALLEMQGRPERADPGAVESALDLLRANEERAEGGRAKP